MTTHKRTTNALFKDDMATHTKGSLYSTGTRNPGHQPMIPNIICLYSHTNNFVIQRLQKKCTMDIQTDYISMT